MLTIALHKTLSGIKHFVLQSCFNLLPAYPIEYIRCDKAKWELGNKAASELGCKRLTEVKTLGT